MPTDIAAQIGAGSTKSLVNGAVKRASASTGARFDFLMKMAARESGFDPSAKAKTSSAAGLFQFIEQTWLSTVKKYGSEHGLGDAAAKINQNADGRYSVANASTRQSILNLRFDPDAASAMAGELANENKSMLESRLGRAVSSADLYTAHFLGPSGAVKLLSAASNVKAADLLPKAAAANHNVFYDGARPKTVGEVAANIAKSMSGATPSAPADRGEPARNTQASSITMAHSPAPVNNYARFIADSFSSPTSLNPRAAAAPPGGFSAIALAVLDALDPAAMRNDRNEREKGLGVR